MNLRLEAYKQALADQSEKTKAVLSFLEPIIQLRRSAYLDFQQAAREAENTLEIYYFRAHGLPSHEVRSHQVEELENVMGIGSGGASSSFRTKGDAVDVVKKLILLRDKYKDVSSEAINTVVDEFIDTIMKDLKDGEQQSNNTEKFHSAAESHLRDSFAKLDRALKDALQFRELPIK